MPDHMFHGFLQLSNVLIAVRCNLEKCDSKLLAGLAKCQKVCQIVEWCA
jgi:hypothetical protein